jgi:hypothetical protein
VRRLRQTGVLARTACLIAAAGLGSGGCTAVERSSQRHAASRDAITLETVSVPLNSQDPSQSAMGDFVYAGGLALSSRQTTRLHGLSDLEVAASGRLTAVGDEGILFEAQLVLDEDERLMGLTDARLVPLLGEDGKALPGKEEADAEGFTQLSNGDRLVSFERRHRILLYPANGGAPRPVPSPVAGFPANAGLEALATDPESGSDAYLAGAEDSGETWLCRVYASCVSGPSVEKSEGFGLVAMKRLPGMRTVVLLRAFDATRGSRVSLQVLRSTTVLARMDLAAPLTVDNFEGLATVLRPDDRVRFYLLSDDNGSSTQRTLLLAFDWHSR